MAVGVSHELPASEVAPAVAQILPKASPQRQVSLVMLLRDLGEVSVRPAVLDLLKNPQQQVRAAAIRALSTLADPSTLPVLYEAASQSDAMAAAAARDTSPRSPSGVDAAVMACSKGGGQVGSCSLIPSGAADRRGAAALEKPR